MRPWPWPDSLDALTAAPKHHKLVLDNDRVRVLDTRIPPGDLVPVHTHRWPAVYYTISGGDFVHYDAEGNVLLDTRIHPNPTGQPARVGDPPDQRRDQVAIMLQTEVWTRRSAGTPTLKR
jgi:hypothetical protein